MNAAPAPKFNVTAVGPYELLYYETNVVDCGYFDHDYHKDSVVFHRSNICHTLKHASTSFNVGGNISSTQIPYKWGIKGYGSKDCTGEAHFFINEGSEAGLCYIEYGEAGWAPIRSLILTEYVPPPGTA